MYSALLAPAAASWAVSGLAAGCAFVVDAGTGVPDARSASGERCFAVAGVGLAGNALGACCFALATTDGLLRGAEAVADARLAGGAPCAELRSACTIAG